MRLYREMEAILQRKTFVNVMDKIHAIRPIRHEEERKDQTLPVLIHQLYKHCTIISQHSDIHIISTRINFLWKYINN